MHCSPIIRGILKFVIYKLCFVSCIIPFNLLAQTPVASFTVQQSSGCVPFQVQFTNTSTGAITYYWDFGNGNYSTAPNPSNVYLNTGSFNVKLVATSASGQSDSIIKSGFINTVNAPVVAFMASATSACLQSSAIVFTNQSSNFDACIWDFGDGNTSTATNPVHTYNTAGLYTVTLIAYNTAQGCTTSLSKTGYINILGSSTSAFNANQVSLCNVQTPVVFQSQSTGAVSWLWNFGDGTTSTQNNPSHIYTQPGVYDVTLITTNSLGCSDTIVKPAYISVLNNPVPVLASLYPFSGCTPVVEVFYTTTSDIASWWWDFGDGTNSQIPSPTHTYATAGTYQASLQVVYNNGCSNSASATIQVYPKPTVSYTITGNVGCAPLTPVFNNTTPGTGNSYLWDLGDGSTSTQQNPVHVYTVQGTYYPTLTVTNAAGCSTNLSTTSHIIVSQVSAQFVADQISGCNPHTVNFSHTGGGNPGTFSWNFGDGTSSNVQSPSHIYTTNGTYTVTLTVSNNTGCSNTYTLPQNIQVSNGSNNFNPSPPVTACAPFTINLYDNSSNTAAWLWDFGDGTTSTLQNPVHTYTNSGTFIVTLQTQSSGSNCSQFIAPYGTYIINAGEPNFGVSQTLCPPFTATFTDYSVNAVAWLWDFGDGTTSTLQHPVHIYAQPGSYNVSLTITTAQGCTFTMYHNYAVTFIPLFANATGTTTDTILPMTVLFNANSSGATNWLWDFGDGNTSTLMNPIHIYTTPGPYNITLTIYNPQCTLTIDYPAVTFGSGEVFPGSGGDSTAVPIPVYSCTPYGMNFSNPVQNTVSWLWDFGDGNTSTLENPDHIYTDPGVYTVSLITWDASGSTDTVIMPAPFYLTGATADFDISYSNGCAGSSITIQNNSINALSYLWDFGDGTTSTQHSPNHTYNTTGVNYIISLTVVDTLGCTDFMARSYYASVLMPMTSNTRRGCAGDTIQFGSSNINFVNYSWDFGDGTTSTDPNPSHVYPDSGSFTVTLSAVDSIGCITNWTLPYPISIRKPIANFTSQLTGSGCFAVRHQFQNLSTGADSYLWDFGNGATSSQKDPLASYIFPGYYNVTLTAFADGCSNTHTSNQHVFFPDLKADFSYVQQSDCYPVTVVYSDSSTDAVSWLWEFGDGTSSTLQNPTHVFNSKPSGDVQLTVRSYVNCPKTIIKPNITAMDVHYSLNDTIGCSPFTFAITDSSQNISSWLWDFGDGTTSTTASPAHTYTANGNFPVTLTAVSPTGCTQIINPIATVKTSGPEAQFSMNAIVSCAPTIVNFYDGSIGATQWNWNFGNTNHSVLQSPVHIYNEPGNYDITLVVSDSTGCSDTLLIPDLVHITGSVANFSIQNTSGCSPWSVQFADSSISAFQWLWNFGDGNVSNQQHPLHVYDVPGNYTITLTTQDTTGCQSVYSNPIPVTVLPQPEANFIIPVTTGCAPFALSIIDSSVSATGYFWDFGDGTTSSSANPSHTYTTPGTYFVTLIATNSTGCSDTMVSMPVDVGLMPVPSFTVGTQTGCAPVSVQFNNTSTNTHGISTYLWSFGDGTISTDANPVHNYVTAGVFNVSLTVSNGNTCTANFSQNSAVVLSDNTPLPPVLLKSVSVLDSSSIEVTWGNLPSQGLQSYKLYRYNPVSSSYNLIYTDNNPGNTSLNVTSEYEDLSVATANQTYQYLVQATNLCSIGTPFNQLIPHTSMNLQVAVQNTHAHLRWNFYEGCIVTDYEIYRQDQLTGAYYLVGIVPATTNEFIDSTVYCNMFVNYRIEATNLCGENFKAWSDVEMIDMPGVLVNQKVDMVRSTVVEDSFVFTEWAPPVLAPNQVTGFDLYRSLDNTNFTLIASLPATETSYSDFDTRVKEQNYFYRVKLKNVCELGSSQGLESSSILLLGDTDDMNDSRLRWTPYVNWDTGVDFYVIERKDEFGIWQTIRTVNGNVLEYIDR